MWQFQHIYDKLVVSYISVVNMTQAYLSRLHILLWRKNNSLGITVGIHSALQRISTISINILLSGDLQAP